DVLEPSSPATAPGRLGRLRALPRWVLATASLAMGLTLYMAAITVAWALHMSSLRATSDQLEQRRVEATTAAEEDRAAAQAVQAQLDEAHHALLLSANRATQADDFALYLSYI